MKHEEEIGQRKREASLMKHEEEIGQRANLINNNSKAQLCAN